MTDGSVVASTRILLADDHPLVLEGVKQLLEPNFSVVGTVQTGQQVLEQAEKLKPDIVLLDANMPGMNGFETARQLRSILPTVRIIFLTMLTEAVAVSEGFRAGAMGYVLKQDASDELMQRSRASWPIEDLCLPSSM